ncbi:hypothetical protein RJ640_026720 [Escallonia rubra]|uniref:Chromo domain-containing protein n=1 Tax=Escallonia rubra TaxID=112253 RepID=A0AA88QQE5_9ASTE|nr:hypothetical protein RJ640_026720 [Escallonia rubra]
MKLRKATTPMVGEEALRRGTNGTITLARARPKAAVNALVLPYNNAVCIMEKGTTCVVPMFEGRSSTMTSMRLSGMRLVQGVEDEEARNEGTYLVSLKVEDHVATSAEQPPKEIMGVLKGKTNAMPRDLPREVEDVLKGKENVSSERPRELKDVLKGKKDVVQWERPNQGEIQADEAKGLDATQVSYDLRRREAEYVLGYKIKRGRNAPPKQHYLVKWKGLPEHQATCESVEELGSLKTSQIAIMRRL